jgi:hypothetical protein
MLHHKCPFYGFRWPQRNCDLIAAGENECGLDLDKNRPCVMESHGLSANFLVCEVAASAQAFVSVVSSRIRFFPPGHAEGIAFEDWHDEVMQLRGMSGLARRTGGSLELQYPDSREA